MNTITDEQLKRISMNLFKLLSFKVCLIISLSNLFKQTYSLPYEYYDGGSLVLGSLFSSLKNISETCHCDLRPNTCDAFCCCDPLCSRSDNATEQWTFYGECWQNPSKLKRYPKCNYKSYTLKNLYSPLSLLSQNYKQGLCVTYDNSKLNNSLHINTDREDEDFINSTSEFDSFILDKELRLINETLAYYQNYTEIRNSFPKYFEADTSRSGVWTKGKYSVAENILISGVSSDTYSTIKLPYRGVFGECEQGLKAAKFLNEEEISCGEKLSLTKEGCEAFNSKVSYSQSRSKLLRLYNTTTNTSVFTENDIEEQIYNVKFQTYQYLIQSNSINTLSKFINLTDNGLPNTCKCSGIQTNKKSVFKMTNETIDNMMNEYYVHEVEGECGEEMIVPITYNTYFINVDEKFNFTKSGSPGYRNGDPMIFGLEDTITQFNNETNVNSTLSYVLQYSEKRKIYGINQDEFSQVTVELNEEDTEAGRISSIRRRKLNDIDELVDFRVLQDTPMEEEVVIPPDVIVSKQLYKPGQCFYNSNNNLALEPHINIDFIASELDIKIYDNPLYKNTLNFGENLSWGCSEQLSFTDLKLLCINQLWKEKMVYNLLNNITFVGEFGNPDRHFILDWIKVDDFDINTYQSIWDDSTNKCLVPSIINLDVIYANYGLVNNTQAGILKVSKRLESTFWYGVEDELSQDGSYNVNLFHTHVRINFFKVSQSTVWFFAPGPKPVFPKNIMYPFRVGKTQYWKNSTINLSSKGNLILLLLGFLFLF